MPMLAANQFVILPIIVVVVAVVMFTLIRKFRLPFKAKLFWTILPTVLALVVIAFLVAVKFFEYEMTNADYGGSFISSCIGSYLIHLWLLPAEYYEDMDAVDDDEDGPYDEESESDATDKEDAEISRPS